MKHHLPLTCLDYRLEKVTQVAAFLRKGYNPFGSAFYHPADQCCYQTLVKYDLPLLPPLNNT
jgi:hypothetical protein